MTDAAREELILPPGVLIDEADREWLTGKWTLHACHSNLKYVSGSAKIDGKWRILKLHRVIMGLPLGDKRVVDHVNGNQLDNRRANLRVTTVQGNNQNRRKALSNTGVIGVHRRNENGRIRYQVNAMKDGKPIYIGSYKTLEIATVVSHEWRTANYPGYGGVCVAGKVE